MQYFELSHQINQVNKEKAKGQRLVKVIWEAQGYYGPRRRIIFYNIFDYYLELFHFCVKIK